MHPSVHCSVPFRQSMRGTHPSSCYTFGQHILFAMLPQPLHSPTPYLPPCLRWQKRHNCPVRWWGCGVGIRAVWAPPSLALEKHSKESSVGPEEALGLTVLLPGGRADLPSGDATQSQAYFTATPRCAAHRLHQEGAQLSQSRSVPCYPVIFSRGSSSSIKCHGIGGRLGLCLLGPHYPPQC